MFDRLRHLEKPKIELRKNTELVQRMQSEMHTRNWATKELFSPEQRVSFQAVERDLPEPPEAAEIRKQTWQAKLTERQTILQEANPGKIYEVREDILGNTPTGEAALFERGENGEEKRVMWAGTTITLARKPIERDRNNVVIPVYPINYTEWIACENPAYAEAFKKAGLPLPYAGIGVSVLMETADGQFILTRRGIETPVYPGRLYSPGGGPKPGETSTGALLQEIVEETGLKEKVHFDGNTMHILALVTDTHYNGGEHVRPELVAYLRLSPTIEVDGNGKRSGVLRRNHDKHVSLTFQEVERIQYAYAQAKGKETDVWAVEPFSSFLPTLPYRLALHGTEMCPPTEAAIAHAAMYKSMNDGGQENPEDFLGKLMNRLQYYRRHEYIPPIEQLSSE